MLAEPAVVSLHDIRKSDHHAVHLTLKTMMYVIFQ